MKEGVQGTGPFLDQVTENQSRGLIPVRDLNQRGAGISDFEFLSYIFLNNILKFGDSIFSNNCYFI